MNPLKRITRSLAIATLLFTLSCGTTPTKPEARIVEIPQGSAASEAVAKWLAGDEEQALEDALRSQTPEARFFTAEMKRWRGDIETSFDLYGAFLVDFPKHPFARYAAARIHTLRNSVVDFSSRAPILFDRVDWGQLTPLTRVYLAMAQQSAEYQVWNDSSSPEPFEGGKVGYPDRWNVTPLVSSWRLLDFDQAFAPETSERLDQKYLRPQMAVDRPENYRQIEPYHPGGISFTHRPEGGDGLYYYESFVTLDADDDREFWLFSSFAGAARLWIDGEEIIVREEGDYSSGKFLTKINLEPGTHRVLVKLAYQRGYRDWFDLMFVPTGARQLTDGGLSFASGCLEARTIPNCVAADVDLSADVEVLTKAKRLIHYEPVYLPAGDADTASDTSLYLAMLSAHFSADTESFDRAWAELNERRPDFAAGYALHAQQIQTLWEVPARLRDAAQMQSLRAAAERDPESAYFLSNLGSELKDSGQDREIREVLEKARELSLSDGELRYAAPIATWAQYLSSQGWEEAADAEWRNLLELAPAHCSAARRVQSLEHGRSLYRHPREITPQWKRCPDLYEAWVTSRDDMIEDELALYEKFSNRLPLRAAPQLRYAQKLVQVGRDKEARALVDTALSRMPRAVTLWNWLIDREVAQEGTESALEMLERVRKLNGTEGWMKWKRAALTGDLPMKSLMPDGHAAAMNAVKASQNASLSNDEAYFVVDFAARLYEPDGSSMTLTHTVVRVMTKGAIDRYGETSIPGDARLILARTVKQDGSTRVPETQSGKATLSMPGLAEGDFVEIAYLQFDGPRVPPSELEGVRFFFRMPDISTLHSEYIILGQVAEFILANDPPKAEPIEHEGIKGVRFLAKDNPRLRAEPRSVPSDEFLPWIQMYRQGLTIGDFEEDRRTRVEQLTDSLKISSRFEELASGWIKPSIKDAAGTEEHVKEIFYRVASHIPDPSAGDFSSDVTHAALTKDGSAHLLLKAAYDLAGIPADVYLARTAYADPEVMPIREFGKYSTPILRITLPGSGGERWASPDGPDATFNALGPALQGEPAICITCEKPVQTRIPTEGLRDNTQNVDVEANVDVSGNLAGTITMTLDGGSAFSLRQALRSRTDETSRQKLMAALSAGIVAGSALTGYEVENEKKPDEALVIRVQFTRPGFATRVAGKFQVETRIFQEAVAQYYAPLSDRVTPILVSSPRDAVNTFTINFPSAPTVVSTTGEQVMDSQWGNFVRSTTVEGNEVRIEHSAQMPIQRVYPADYEAFQRWAIAVEQSSALFATYGE